MCHTVRTGLCWTEYENIDGECMQVCGGCCEGLLELRGREGLSAIVIALNRETMDARQDLQGKAKEPGCVEESVVQLQVHQGVGAAFEEVPHKIQ